jgi:hypothetical protein
MTIWTRVSTTRMDTHVCHLGVSAPDLYDSGDGRLDATSE